MTICRYNFIKAGADISKAIQVANDLGISGGSSQITAVA